MQATQDKAATPTRLSVRASLLWLIGSFVAPFLLVALVSIAIAYWLMGSNAPQLPTLLLMGAYYGLLAGILGFAAVAVSFLAGKYWFLLASFTVPTLLIGGFWGTWSWAKYCDDVVRSSIDQQPRSLSLWQELIEWLTYVGRGCLEIGLIAGLIVSVAVCFSYLNHVRNKKTH